MIARNRRPGHSRRARRRPIDILSPADIAVLIDACSGRSASGLRDRALIATLYATGVRITEALSLLPWDVDLDARSVVIQNGKGDRRRTVGVLEDAVEPLARWLERRRELGIDDRRTVFCTITRASRGVAPTQFGRLLSREHVGRTLRRLARRAGILKRTHPHGFRHAHCALLRSRGLDVYAIKVQLGHEHLNTTDLYLHRLGAHELPERLRRIGPVLRPPGDDARSELAWFIASMSTVDAAALVARIKTTGP